MIWPLRVVGQGTSVTTRHPAVDPKTGLAGTTELVGHSDSRQVAPANGSALVQKRFAIRCEQCHWERFSHAVEWITYVLHWVLGKSEVAEICPSLESRSEGRAVMG